MATYELDNRGLPPPEPMVRILGELAALGPEDDLEVLMDREPMLLYPELERRGFRWTFGPRPRGGEGFLLATSWVAK
jgi:uncharacterized protein (DUF2249 family)